MTEKINTTQLLDLMENAGEADLAVITARIDALKLEIQQFAAARHSEIKSLGILRRILAVKVAPEASRKSRKSRAAEGDERTELQKRIFDLLASEGPMPVPAIAARLNMLPKNIGRSICSCTWFVSEYGEVKIAKTKATA